MTGAPVIAQLQPGHGNGGQVNDRDGRRERQDRDDPAVAPEDRRERMGHQTPGESEPKLVWHSRERRLRGPVVPIHGPNDCADGNRSDPDAVGRADRATGGAPWGASSSSSL